MEVVDKLLQHGARVHLQDMVMKIQTGNNKETYIIRAKGSCSHPCFIFVYHVSEWMEFTDNSIM